MVRRRYTLWAFCFGLYYSVVVVWYTLNVMAHQASRAATVDLILGLLAIGSLQAWEASGRKFSVLLAEVVGMSLGTWIAAR